jgi:hypothetical protein
MTLQTLQVPSGNNSSETASQHQNSLFFITDSQRFACRLLLVKPPRTPCRRTAGITRCKLLLSICAVIQRASKTASQEKKFKSFQHKLFTRCRDALLQHTFEVNPLHYM